MGTSSFKLGVLTKSIDMENSIILFDGVCNLCDGVVQFVLKKDKKARFRFAALQSECGTVLLKQIGLSTTDYNSFVLVEMGNVYQKSEAALRVLKGLGGVWKLLYFFMVIPRPIRDYIYDWIAQHRYRFFGKKDECMLPTPEIRARFLK
jgi:predicted DCC family thiol-disulfide oxidoreductase YuxK